jgi:hypothetical protein
MTSQPLARWFRLMLIMAPAAVPSLVLAAALVLPGPAAPQQPSTENLTLAEPTLVHGVLCVERALLHPSGLLHECRLAPGAEFLGHRFPPNSWVGYNVNGRPHVWLGRNTELQGLVCIGKGWRQWSTGLHVDGTLRGCYLAAPAVVDGVPCRKASFPTEVLWGSSYVGLHENGRLAECVARHGFTLGGRAFRRGERVRLDANGQPMERGAPGS